MAAVKPSGLKSNMVGEFILVKLLNATNKAFYFFFFSESYLAAYYRVGSGCLSGADSLTVSLPSLRS